MTKIFISYRRADSQLIADRIHDHMIAHFGEGNVFQDVDNIPFGVDFPDYLSAEVNKCDAVLVVIGSEWERHIQARARQPDDFVRIEVESALQLGKLVIPVLVNGASMPDPARLPESLRPLCRKNAAKVRPNPDFRRDCQVLADNIKLVMAGTVKPPTPPADPTQAAIARARAFTGTRNRDWQPYITTFPDCPIPDMPFCLVPVGSFTMGSDKGNEDEKPAHPQRIGQPYWITQYPVTNGQWAQAVRAGVVKEPIEIGDSLKWYQDPAMRDAPVVGVDWFMAGDFAQPLGCRLPSELEWEYAARGVESWLYPWGGEWKPDFAVWSDNSDDQPAVVMTRAEGKSWVGAAHLSGNVWEWTNSLYEPYPYQAEDGRERDTGDSTEVLRVLRGGSFDFSQHLARAVYRNYALPNYRFSLDFGFRLVRPV